MNADEAKIAVQVLEEKKTEVVAQIAVSAPATAMRLGYKVEALEELIKDLTPKPDPLEYYVIYKVRWQPESFGDVDAPMDREHKFSTTDERIISYEMANIGDAQYLMEEHDIDITKVEL